MQATNSGKVVTPYDLDREKTWNHVDFVTDALVTKGNSGSPVFAISCRTGSLELVGLYHAGYRGSPALNVVVGIDQLHDLMENFRKSKPPTPDPHDVLGPTTHATILSAVQTNDFVPFFAVGDRVARVRPLPNGRLAYDIFGSGFPMNDTVDLTLEEIGDASGGALEQVTLTSGGVARRSALATLDGETQDALRSLFDLSRQQLLLTLGYRAAAAQSDKSRDSFRRARELAQQLDGHRALGLDLLHGMTELASRLPLVVQPLAEAPPVVPIGAVQQTSTR
jgi:serine protease Do